MAVFFVFTRNMMFFLCLVFYETWLQQVKKLFIKIDYVSQSLRNGAFFWHATRQSPAVTRTLCVYFGDKRRRSGLGRAVLLFGRLPPMSTLYLESLLNSIDPIANIFRLLYLEKVAYISTVLFLIKYSDGNWAIQRRPVVPHLARR